MVINMAYVEIPKYKVDKYIEYAKMLKAYSEQSIMSHNEVSNHLTRNLDLWLFQVPREFLLPRVIS